MGLGKTIQTIAFLLSEEEKKSIIISPTSLIYNWKAELEKFAPSLKVAIIHGEKRERLKFIDDLKNYDVILTTYGTLRMDIDKYEDVTFDYCDLRKIDMMDVVFENCNLSNISFSKGSIYRTEFINCKLMGTRFDECSMKNVLFNSSLGKYSNFAYAKLDGVNIIESDFQSSVFQELQIKKLAFDSTNLSKAVFYNTKLKGIDFTTCNIDDIQLGVNDISGASVSVVQALELTRLMGIIIT